MLVSLLGFAVPARAAEAPQGRFLVCLDPGHGGSDSGATGNGILEKDVNLDIALRTRPLLQQKGYAVMMTRKTDTYVSLDDRCKKANAAGASLFMSIHNNSYTVDSEGTETYCYYNSEDGRRLAAAVHREVVLRLKRADRGVKEAGFYVLKHSDMTSALLEGLFVSNPDDAKMLADPKVRQLIADGVADGVNDYAMDPGRFNEYLLLSNPDPKQTAAVEYDFMRGDGRVQHLNREVPPSSRVTLHVDEYVLNNDVSTRVTSTNGVPVVAERSMYFDFELGSGGHCAPGVTAPGTDWYFAEGSSAWGFSTFILVQNPGDLDTTVTMDFLRSDATTVTHQFNVAKHSRMTVNAGQLEGLASADFSTRVRSELPVISERAMYFNRIGTGTRGGHDSPGIAAPSKTWYMAEGCTRPGFDTYVLLGNPYGQDTVAHLSFLLPSGQSVNLDYPLKAKSRKNVHLNEIRELANADVSTEVRCDTPILAERSVYFDYKGIKEGSNSTAAAAPSRQWYMAEGYTGEGFDTYVLLMNPGEEDTIAELTFLLPTGESKHLSTKVAARSRYTLRLNDVEGLQATDVSTTVTSGKPLLAERAMYFKLGSQSGGHSALGAEAPSLTWYFAEGCTR